MIEIHDHSRRIHAGARGRRRRLIDAARSINRLAQAGHRGTHGLSGSRLLHAHELSRILPIDAHEIAGAAAAAQEPLIADHADVLQRSRPRPSTERPTHLARTKHLGVSRRTPQNAWQTDDAGRQ